PIDGGDVLLLAPPSADVIKAFKTSEDGSYVMFFAQQQASTDHFLYGSPTDVAEPMQFGPAMGARIPKFAVDPDGSHIAFIADGDLFAGQTDTGTVINLLDGFAGTAQSFQIVRGGEDILLNRGIVGSVLSTTDLFSIDGSTLRPLTSAFPDPQIFEQVIFDDSVVMRVDQDSINSLAQDPVIYRIAFDGSPGTILSRPGMDLSSFRPLFAASREAVVFEDAEERLWFVPFVDGAQTLVSGRSTVPREIRLGDKLFFRGWTDPSNPLVELYAVDIEGSTLFVDGFESGDTSRWDIAAP
ncbi:MAG: hypothetical protein AAGM22_28760, partial [Acidobacteriota bacterium]